MLQFLRLVVVVVWRQHLPTAMLWRGHIRREPAISLMPYHEIKVG
jgi:hypothetical protein